MHSLFVEALHKILSRFPDVRLHRVKPWGDFVVAVFQIDDPTLVNKFAAHAENANVSLKVWSSWYGQSVKGCPTDWREDIPCYEFRIDVTDGSYGPIHICARLIYDLLKRGLMTKDEVDKVLNDIGYFDWQDS